MLRSAIRAFEAAFQLVLPIPFAFGRLLYHHTLGPSSAQLITHAGYEHRPYAYGALTCSLGEHGKTK